MLLSSLTVAVALMCVPAFADAECPNEALRTGLSAALPDCRAYEMVSPPFKNGGGLGLRLVATAPNGSALMIESTAAFAGSEGNPALPPYSGMYSMQRSPTGWVTRPENPPASEYLPFLLDGILGDFTGVSQDARATLWRDRAATQPDNAIDLYLRRDDGTIVDVGPSLPPSAPHGLQIQALGEPAQIASMGMSVDTSHVLFNLQAYYWPFDHTQPGYDSLYEYLGVGNTTPMLVGVDDDGRQISQCGAVLGSGNPAGSFENEFIYSSHNVMSSDGNTVFFTAYPCSAGSSSPPVAELFARIDNGMADAHTVAISEPTVADCAQCDTRVGALAEAQFVAASTDGSKVFFTTEQPLLEGHGGLYEYDFDAQAGMRVRLVARSSEVIQVSEDGSHLYLRSSEVITETPNSEGQRAQPGAGNVYVYDARTARVQFITDGEVGQSNVTPDGRYLVFLSRSHLTPDDTGATRQVFEYDAQTGTLTRVSVGQGGFGDNGNAPCTPNFVTGGCVEDMRLALPPSYGTTPYRGPYAASTYPTSLSVSADGQYVVFQSPYALTPQANNDKLAGLTEEGSLPIYANNVYEYHDGVVSLISDSEDVTAGSETSSVKLFGIDESGKDVFFITASQLVAQDTDENLDVYDARVDGGFPAPAAPPECSGDACQGPLSAAPTLLSSGSELQLGGNPAQSPASSSPAKPKPKVKAKTKTKKLSKKGSKRKKRRRMSRAKKTTTRSLRARGARG